MPIRRSTPFQILMGIVAIGAISWLVFQLAGSGSGDPDPDFAPEGEARDANLAAGLGDEASVESPVGDDSAAPEGGSGQQRIDVVPPESTQGAQRLVEGRVALPLDTPPDEMLFVLALDHSRTLQEIYAGEALADLAWNPEIEREGVLGIAPVQADKSFSLAVPEAVEVVHLALSGRYIYSESSSECRLPLDEGGVQLAGELGAWITGRISAPSPEGIEIKLGPDITGSLDPSRLQRFGYKVESLSAADGSYEFRAVPTAITYGLLIRHDSLAAHLQLGLRPAPGEHMKIDVPLLSGARLSGRVIDDGGLGLAGIEVGARLPGPIGQETGDLRSTETAEGGFFTLGHVALGKLVLRAESEGYAAATQPIEGELVDGQEISGLELVLRRGESVRGTVHFSGEGPTGGAVANGAAVRVAPDLSQLRGGIPTDGMNLNDGGSTESAEDGSFTVSGLGVGPFVVTAGLELEDGDRAGAWSARVGVVAGGTSDLLLSMDRLASVRGRVIDQLGEAVTSFTVRATLEGSGGMLGMGAEEAVRPVEDSEDGTFLLEEMIRPGSWSFEVTAPSLTASSITGVELPLASPTEELLFQLEPAAGVAGIVLDSFGNPVAGASVAEELPMIEALTAQRRGELTSVISDSEGGFLLNGLDPGSVAIVARKDGFAESEPVTVELSSGEVVEEVTLQLRIGGLLTGEVFDEEGELAVGRMIIVRPNENPTKQRLTPTDMNGEFREEHLAPGSYQVISMRNFMTGEVDINGGESLGDLLSDLKMEMAEIVDGEETHVILGKPPEDPITIEGVVTHSGEPVAGMMVSLMPEDSAGLGDLKITTTGDDGGFQVVLEKRGNYLVTAQNVIAAGMQNSVEFRETIPEDGDRYRMKLVLPHGRISGSIVDSSGKPAVGCRITLSAEGGIPLGSFLGGNYADVSADAEGNYDIPYLRPGSYSLSAGGVFLGGMLGDSGISGGRVIRSGLEVSEGEWLRGIDFRLSDPGELSGTVRAAGGSPVASAAIFVRDEDGNLLERFSMIVSDAAGKFSYPGLAPGRYEVTASLDDQVSPPGELVSVPEGGRGEIDVTLDVGITMTVTVVDKSGAPIQARVSVVDSEGREMSGMISLQAITKALGEGFVNDAQQVGPLPPGKYRVTAILDDGRQEDKRVTLRAGRIERHVTLRID
jgi:hypothetical protein